MAGTNVTSTPGEGWEERARRVMPGGVSSPVRAWRGVGGTPPFIRSARGARVVTEEGRELIDFVGSWGAMLLGHAPDAVVDAVREAALLGTSFGATCRREVELAERIVARVPSLEMVRFVNSGTEATMSALRLARAATGRSVVVKFEGCYHGHADSFLIDAGSGAATLGVPSSPGVTPGTAADTRTARFNDAGSVEAIMDALPGQVACVIVEPVAGNVGCIPPEPGFLRALRTLCDREGALLIFDEVITGFRVARGGAQQLYDVRPDLTTMGKILGGGLPVGAYGGPRSLMARVAPEGPVYQAGTLAGNPLAMAAGIALLDEIDRIPDLYARLEAAGARLALGIQQVVHRRRLEGRIAFQRVGSIFSLHFARGPLRSWDDVKRADRSSFARWFHALFRRGISIAPSPFEAGFLSAAHTDADVDRFVAEAESALVECLGGDR